MSAPVQILSKQQQKQSLRSLAAPKKQKKPSSKNVLKSPYSDTWPFVPKELENDALKRFKECFPIKLHPQYLSNKERKLVKKQRKENCLSEEQSQEIEQRKLLRSELCIGINAVTKALEKDALRLVIVSRDSHAKVLVKHLLALVGVRKCAAMCLPNLGENTASFTGILSLAAIGFKKMEGASQFQDFIQYIIDNAPPIVLPCLQNATFRDDGTSSEEDIEEEPQTVNVKKEISSPKDYSYLYKYKLENKMGDDFISLKGSVSLSEEDYFPSKSKISKKDDQSNLKSFRYHNVNVGAIQPNLKRKKKGK